MIDYTLLDKKIVIICGATATGKSHFAIKLASKLNGVIINADSMQVYKEIPILTAQPNKHTILEIPHKLYGIVSCDDKFSVGIWLDKVIKEIDKCFLFEKVPILVGGTGMYISSLIEGLAKIPEISQKTKMHVLEMTNNMNNREINHFLKKYDVEAANLLKQNDRQRNLRAIEVYFQTGKSITYWQKIQHRYFNRDKIFIIYINPERKVIYENINNRFLYMLQAGAIKEVKALLKNNKKQKNFPKALGLHQLILYINGKTNIEEAIEKSQQLTRNYAKRQITWFNNKIKHDYLINTLEV